MLYQSLNVKKLCLGPKETIEFDAGCGCILIPNPNSKIFLHWLTKNGKMRASYTMTKVTRVEDTFKLINGQDLPTDILVVLYA